MHEYSVAVELYSVLMNEAMSHGAKRISLVELEIGALTMINSKQLSYCLEVLAAESIAEGMEVSITRVVPRIRCECGYEGELECDGHTPLHDLVLSLHCPQCANSMPEIISGREIRIRAIRMELREDARHPN